MGRMVGADPEQLDELGRAMAGAAQQLSAVSTRVRAQLHAVEWSGSDAQAFRHAWDAVHRRILEAATTRLHDAASTLHRNADEQRQASAVTGPAGGGTAAPAGLTGGFGTSVPVPAAGGDPGDQPGAPGGAAYVIGPSTEPPLTYTDSFPYDPNARPTPADHLSWAKWGAQAAGAHLLRPDLDDALRVYDHYRDNSGTSITVDYEEAYREDANIAKAVDTEIGNAQAAAERLAAESGSSSFSMTGDATMVGTLGGYPATENWQKALGDHQLWSSADVTIVDGVATMTITVHAHDRYDFNAGMSDIATGTPDDENGRFAVLGWAKPFDTAGQLTRTITWNVGDADGVSAGDGDVSRNPTTEDRPDELGSGRPAWPPIPGNTPLDGT